MSAPSSLQSLQLLFSEQDHPDTLSDHLAFRCNPPKGNSPGSLLMAARVGSSLPAIAGMTICVNSSLSASYLSPNHFAAAAGCYHLIACTDVAAGNLTGEFFLAAGNLVLDSHQWKFSTYAPPEKNEKPRKEKTNKAQNHLLASRHSSSIRTL